jgi:hypothetical protein
MKKFFSFLVCFLFPFFANAGVVINEVCWMGTSNSSNDEWIELYNNTTSDIDLSGWILKSQDDTPLINLSGVIKGGEFFLLERTDDSTIPNIPADLIYTGALSNSGEILILKNGSGEEIDKVDASGGWPAGDNSTKQTMQRTASGTWITADSTPRNQNTGSQSQSNQTSTSSQENSASGSWLVEPQIYANAGEDKTVVAGADAVFTGQALGLQKEPLEGARYMWSFGDGASAEGKSVRHFYKYPGEYIVFLNVSSGGYSASDSAFIKVIPNQLKIIEANADFIKLKNESSATLDISGWFLKVESKTFKFPQITMIKAGAVLTVDSSISGLAAGSGKAELLYPNGSLVFTYQRNGTQAAPAKIAEEIKTSELAPESEIKNTEDKTGETQVANAASSVNIDKSSNFKKWLIVVLGLGLVSGAGFIFIKNGIKK